MITFSKRMDATIDQREAGMSRHGEKWLIAKISSTTIDSEGDVLLPAGADLTLYRKNPIVTWQHENEDQVLGKAVGIRPTPTDIVAKIVFAARPKSHPPSAEWKPDTIHDLYKQGMMSGFSVYGEVLPGGARRATRDDVARFGEGVERIVTRWRMLALGAVNIPANPDAMVLEVSKARQVDLPVLRLVSCPRLRLVRRS